MNNAQQRNAFISLDLLPLDVVMIVGTASGAEYEVTRLEDNSFAIAGGLLEDDVLFTDKKPHIAGFGQPAQLGAVLTSAVEYVTFEPRDDEEDGEPAKVQSTQPQGSAGVAVVIDLNTYRTARAIYDALKSMESGVPKR